MTQKVFKPAFIRQAEAGGEINVDEPITITLSDESVDRQGDIVEGFVNLRAFSRNNPILLWQHQNFSPIGKLTRVWKEGTLTLGKFLLGEEGTSELVDTVRSLVRQGIIRAGSVGFRPGEVEPLDPDKPWGGLRLMKNELLEFSLVSVPANANALIHGKGLSEAACALLRGETASILEFPAHKQLGLTPPSQASDDATPKPTPKPERRANMEGTSMSLAQKIEAAQKQLEEKSEVLAALAMDGPQEGETEEEHGEQMTTLTVEVNGLKATVDRLVNAENAIAVKTIATRQSVKTTTETGEQVYKTERPGHLVTAKKTRKKGSLAFETMAHLLRAHIKQVNAFDLLEKDNLEDKAELEITIRAATAPADMTTPAWAGNLVQDTWGEFVELLRDISVYPSLPGWRLEFDRYGTIKLPKNDGRGTLAGDFFAEGSPIPVKEGVIGMTDLTPKNMGVISSYTKDIGRHSTPALSGIMRDQMLADTAEILDVRLTDNGARSALRPAGYQDPTETGAANINAATTNTVAGIISDTTAMIQRMMTARVSTTAVWILNPINLVYLRNIQDAASGEFVFRAEIAAGTFAGYPYIASQNIPVDLLILQGNGSVAYATDYAPMVEVSDQATLVYDDTAPDHIVDGGTVTTQPVQSLFQMNGVALKLTMGLDWRIVRMGGIQVLTGVAWAP